MFDVTNVRIGWPPEGQPAWKIDEDVVVLRAILENDPMSQIRDRRVQGTGGNTIETYTYFRVWRIVFDIWGPNAVDNCRKLKSGLLQDAFVHDALAGANFTLVTDMPEGVRNPQLFAGQWWEKVEFFAIFNELVSETPAIQGVGNLDITFQKENGLTREINLSEG